jgi:nucleotide-binding universal stress UspA family protein
MRPSEAHPIVLAFPLDYGAEDVMEAAGALARELGAPVLPVHATRGERDSLAALRASDRERDTIEAWLEPLARKGITVRPPIVERGRAEQIIPSTAARVGAPLTIVGSGRGATIRDWLLGTTAERIVRASAGPVWIARGTMPSPKLAVLVPVDLGAETRFAILAGARWARLFGATLRIVHVLPEVEPLAPDRSAQAIEELETRARARVAEVLAQVDIDVPVEVRLTHGPIGSSLLREADDAGLIVIAQPDYEMLVPASLGSHVERLIRAARCSVIAVRDDDVSLQRVVREERAAWVALLRTDAEKALADGDPARAERILASAKLAAPASPRVEDVLARAIESQGRTEEAERHRALARWLRAELG